MADDVRYPTLYQINTRVWLTELSRVLGRRATLDDIPDAELDRIARFGFDWVWLLSVWQTGPAAQAISRAHAEWCREFADSDQLYSLFGRMRIDSGENTCSPSFVLPTTSGSYCAMLNRP